MIHKREGCSGGSWRLEYVLKYPLDPAWDRCQGQCSGPAHQIAKPVCISTGAWSPPVTLSWPHSDVILSLPIKQRTTGVVSGRGGRAKDFLESVQHSVLKFYLFLNFSLGSPFTYLYYYIECIIVHKEWMSSYWISCSFYIPLQNQNKNTFLKQPISSQKLCGD